MACGSPEVRQRQLEQYREGYLRSNPATSPEIDLAKILKDMESLIEQKRKLFPDDHRQIVSAKVVHGRETTIASKSHRIALSNGWEKRGHSETEHDTGRQQATDPAQARQKLQKGLRDYLAGNDPGPIAFSLKRTKKASETYPLKLTQLQRETLLQFSRLSRA